MYKAQQKILCVPSKLSWLGVRWSWMNSIKNWSIIKLTPNYQVSQKINNTKKLLKFKVLKLLKLTL